MRDAGRHLPVALLLDGHAARGGVQHGRGRGGGGAGDLLVDLEAGRLHGVVLCFNHSVNMLFVNLVTIKTILMMCCVVYCI